MEYQLYHIQLHFFHIFLHGFDNLIIDNCIFVLESRTKT